MRYTIALSVSLLSLALLSGCHYQQEKPLSLVTPQGYSKPQPIEKATSGDSWQKKALMAMIAPSIAEKAEAAEKLKAQSPKIVARAKSGKSVRSARGRLTSSVKMAKRSHHRKAKARHARHGRRARR